MIKKSIFTAIILLSIITSSCKKTYLTDETKVVINEVLPVNNVTMADQNGKYDDWIELFNLSNASINLSGYFLSDDKKNPGKWMIPQGTTIEANSYLIIWADGDTTELGLHSNFKLSSTGEEVILSDPEKEKLDKIEFPAQSLELSWSRVPNGTGDFQWQSPTYNRTNGSK